MLIATNPRGSRQLCALLELGKHDAQAQAHYDAGTAVHIPLDQMPHFFTAMLGAHSPDTDGTPITEIVEPAHLVN